MASLNRRRRKVCVAVSRAAVCEIQVVASCRETDGEYIGATRIDDAKLILGAEADGVWIGNAARYNSVNGTYLGSDPAGSVRVPDGDDPAPLVSVKSTRKKNAIVSGALT